MREETPVPLSMKLKPRLLIYQTSHLTINSCTSIFHNAT
jgi:hypothetical protein